MNKCSCKKKHLSMSQENCLGTLVHYVVFFYEPLHGTEVALGIVVNCLQRYDEVWAKIWVAGIALQVVWPPVR